MKLPHKKYTVAGSTKENAGISNTCNSRTKIDVAVLVFAV
jgi:hypothetical protein